MKRVFLVLLAMLLALSMVLSSCNTPDSNGGTPSQSSTPKADPEPDPEPEPYTASTQYLPEDFATEFKDIFEGKTSTSSFAALDLANAPYSPADLFTISDCKVSSITIPVYKTLAADANGNFKFTIYVVFNSFTGMKKAAASKHEISINAEEHNLAESSTVFKYVTVDLSEYDIVLTESQSLAFGDKTDTIVPAYLKTSASSLASDKWKRDFGVLCMFSNVTTTSLSYSRNSVFFDFTLEKTYESEEAYDAFLEAQDDAEYEYETMLHAVNAYYGNKYLSLLGDSISTYDGITNSTKYLASMGNYRCYYRSNHLPDYSMTYWGRLQSETRMKLCVINSWSSSRVYGGGQDANNNKNAKLDNILVRSSLLHNVSGQTPDLVIIYMGINDTNNSPSSIKTDKSSSLYTENKPAGDLYKRLVDRNTTKTEHEIVDEWFKEVKAIAEAAGSEIVPGKTYNTWEAAYALAIENILTKYNNPDIFCMTLIPTIHANAEEKLVGRANVCIRAIANYFGVGIIDQDNSEINLTNCHVYGWDEGTKVNSLHLNIKGHEMTTRLIIRTLYEHIQNKKNG